MRILALNLTPLDLTYFTSKKLNLEVEYKPLTKIFPSKFLYSMLDQSGSQVSLYTPDVHSYLETIDVSIYDFVLVGWNPTDYPAEFIHSGGYTFPIPLKNKTFCSGIRLDGSQINYARHELMHCICDYINIILGDHTPKDFMDSTPVGSQFLPYYKNDTPDAPDGNFVLTWKGVEPFIVRLNALVGSTATLTRGMATGKETLGTMVCTNSTNTLALQTLELPDLHNMPNISCIPKGNYRVMKTFSLTHFRWMYEILNVPNRTGVRFDVANYYYQLNGCIAIGMNLIDINKDGQLDTSQSTEANVAFEKFFNNKEFILTIK